MATGKPLSKSTLEDIRTDWRQGRLSQRHIASKYKISIGAVNRICKGVEQDLAPIVNGAVEYKQKLIGLSEREVNAVESTVQSIVGRLEYLNQQAMKNVQEAMEQSCEEQADFRSRADTILKAKETLVGKTPETAIQINNQMNAPPAKIEWEVIEHTPNTDSAGIPPIPPTGKV